nr:hypothetical protein Iba_chr07aCG8390 [Ipomoea batatas]
MAVFCVMLGRLLEHNQFVYGGTSKGPQISAPKSGVRAADWCLAEWADGSGAAGYCCDCEMRLRAAAALMAEWAVASGDHWRSWAAACRSASGRWWRGECGWGTQLCVASLLVSFPPPRGPCLCPVSYKPGGPLGRGLYFPTCLAFRNLCLTLVRVGVLIWGKGLEEVEIEEVVRKEEEWWKELTRVDVSTSLGRDVEGMPNLLRGSFATASGDSPRTSKNFSISSMTVSYNDTENEPTSTMTS